MVIKILISTFAPLKYETIRVMDYLKQFVIPFVGLSIGNHRFTYVIDDKFFESFSYGEIRQAHVQVGLDLNKSERMLILNFELSGTVRVSCDRCAGEFDLPVEGNEELFVRFGHENSEEDDNVIIISDKESQIDISTMIYDFINLMIPFRVVHPDDADGESTCDPEVIKKLNDLSSHESNGSTWDKLKDLNFE